MSARTTLHEQLESSTRVDDVTDRLVTAIAIGEYLPGTRLPAERDLAAALGVARMTVRSALSRLAERGLVETRRGRAGGSYVLQQWPDSSTEAVGRILSQQWDELADRSEAVCRLHGVLSRLAAERRTGHDVELLHARLAGYADAATGRDAQVADALLHKSIIDAAHNTTLRTLLEQLEATGSVSAPLHLWGEPSRMREMELRALGEHTRLVNAIVDGRADDADDIARAHVAIDLEHIATALRRAGLEPHLPAHHGAP